MSMRILDFQALHHLCCKFASYGNTKLRLLPQSQRSRMAKLGAKFGKHYSSFIGHHGNNFHGLQWLESCTASRQIRLTHCFCQCLQYRTGFALLNSDFNLDMILQASTKVSNTYLGNSKPGQLQIQFVNQACLMFMKSLSLGALGITAWALHSSTQTKQTRKVKVPTNIV